MKLRILLRLHFRSVELQLRWSKSPLRSNKPSRIKTLQRKHS